MGLEEIENRFADELWGFPRGEMVKSRKDQKLAMPQVSHHPPCDLRSGSGIMLACNDQCWAGDLRERILDDRVCINKR